MPKPQPSFTAEFKHEAVQLTKTSDKPKAQIARELGSSDSALYAWCKAAEAHGEEAFPGKGHQHLLAHPALKYAFVAEHCRDYPVTVMWFVLEVSVSGYYAWRKREPSQRPKHRTIKTQSEKGVPVAA